jgi:hypothetical protein
MLDYCVGEYISDGEVGGFDVYVVLEYKYASHDGGIGGRSRVGELGRGIHDGLEGRLVGNGVHALVWRHELG